MAKKGFDNFIKLILKFSTPLSSVILMILGSAYFTTFVSVYLNSHGYSKGEIGIVQSAFYLGMLLGAFPMENVIKRVGHVQALAVFGSVATTSTLLLGLFPSLIPWVVLRFLNGVSLAALYIVIESWMLYHSSVKTRGTVLSLYMIALYLSQAASQQILSFIDLESLMPYILSAVFTSLSIIPVGLSTNKIRLPDNEESMSLKKLMKISPFGFAGCVISGLALSAVYTFFPIFAVSRDVLSANLMSVTILGGVLLQWPLGKLSDYFERRKTLLGVVVLALVLSLVGFVYTGNDPYLVLAYSFLFGGFVFTLYPLSITQVCDHLDESYITVATALLLVAYGIGSVTGPVISSYFIGFLGVGSLFIYFVLILGALACVGTYSMILRPVVPLEDQGDYVALPNVTPIAYEMDPRGENAE